jgi:hypothetical protein
VHGDRPVKAGRACGLLHVNTGAIRRIFREIGIPVLTKTMMRFEKEEPEDSVQSRRQGREVTARRRTDTGAGAPEQTARRDHENAVNI